MDDTSPGLSTTYATRPRASPERRQKGNNYAQQTFTGADPIDSSVFSMAPGLKSVSNRSSQKNFLDPTSRDFVASESLGSSSLNQFSWGNNGNDFSYCTRTGGFGTAESGLNLPVRPPGSNNISGYNSGVGSRAGSLPPSRSDIDPSSRIHGNVQNLQYARFGQSAIAHRTYPSANAPPLIMHTGPSGHRIAEQQSSMQLDSLASQFDQLNVGNQQRRPSYPSSHPSPNSTSDQFSNSFSQDSVGDAHGAWGVEANGYLGLQDRLSSTSSNSGLPQNQYQGAFGGQYSHSPSDSDARLSHHSPFFPTAGTPPNATGQNVLARVHPPSASTAQAVILERRLQGLQQQQQGYTMPQQNPAQFRNQIPYPYDMNTQQALRINSLNSYYPVPPASHLLTSSHIPRGPARDHDLAGHLRSALLEEFRNSGKTNKRYELKDIYNHIVEFSGDQHGSRFIQQKLEQANSDEKEQVFQELHPNARQLMTDVFGNYVIQKFFEHGNQVQKKMLADQMKNHVLALSTQMYGCRVVQKALEHILTDQQASLIKELEHDIMRCVKDQNGNHVVQKAIERVPAEHMQFIINAFHGKVGENATHPYGCRVIQRMLEHCEEPTRSAILHELHACASSLINDQYGNYVTQHVIEHGRPEDRSRIINLVICNLVNYSKHKFASNVVEKSIEFGSMEERQRIVQTMTVTNERGESPVQTLIRDQYEKLLTHLKESEWTDFAEPVKVQVALLKRFSFSKQIASIEKLLYTGQLSHHMQNPGLQPPAMDTSAAPTLPLVAGDVQSPRSSSHDSTHAGSMDAATDSRKSSENAYGILTPTST
ncbi:MAG: hypothetical protein Q9217_005402 [Psora testacea]